MSKAHYRFLGIIFLITLLSSVTFVSGQIYAFSSYADMDAQEKYFKSKVWGSKAAGGVILNSDFESDNDVDTLLSWNGAKNVFNIENNDSQIEKQVIDMTDSSFGKNTNDWTGERGSTTDLAFGGVEYWVPNGTSSEDSEDNSNAPTVSTAGIIGSPASGGYKMTWKWTMDGETVEASDFDVNARRYDMPAQGDFAGVNVELTADSYVLINVGITHSVINATAKQHAGMFFTISDSGGSSALIIIDSGTSNGGTTDDTFVDGSFDAANAYENALADASGVSDIVTYQNDVSGTTEENIVLLKKVEDLFQTASTFSGSSAASISNWGTYAGSQYSSTSAGLGTATVEVRQLLFFNTLSDAALYEDTDTTSSTTQQSDNFLNGSSMSLDESDEYPLSDGYQFNLGVPINRLSLSSLDYVINPSSHEINYGTSSLVRTDVFDTSIGDDEPFTEPSTYYVNFTNIDSSSFMSQIGFEGEEAWDGDKLKSGYAITDATQSYDKISEIYDADLEGDLRFTPDTAVSNANEYEVSVTLNLGEDVVSSLEANAKSGAGGGVSSLGIGFSNRTLWIIGIVAAVILLGAVTTEERKM